MLYNAVVNEERENKFIRVPEEEVKKFTLREGVNAYLLIDQTLPKLTDSWHIKKTWEEYQEEGLRFLKKLQDATSNIESQGGKYLGFTDEIVWLYDPNVAGSLSRHRIITVIASK